MTRCPVCDSKIIRKFVISEDSRNIATAIYKYVECGVCDVLRLPIKANTKYYHNNYGEKYYNNKSRNGFKQYSEYLFSKFINFQKNKLIFNAIGSKKMVKILDVGAGDLSFLKSVHGSEFNKIGIDIYRSKESDKKIEVVNADFLKHDFGSRKFDVITSWHVIEHIAEPSKFLQKIYSQINNNGVVVISTPNLNSFGYKWFNKNWYHLDAPRHIVMFTEKSLMSLARKAGFKDIQTKNMFYEFPFDLWHSTKKSGFAIKALVFLFYPILKVFDRETITLILKK